MQIRLAWLIEGEDGLLRVSEMIHFGEKIGDEILMDGNYLDPIGLCRVYDPPVQQWVDAAIYSRLEDNNYYGVVGEDGRLEVIE